MLNESVIVAAHPDDEILWFSSILSRVGKVLICFIDKPSDPGLGIARRKALAGHPCTNLSILNLEEAGVFSSLTWTDPVATPYGLEIRTGNAGAQRYRENFDRLMEVLPARLEGCRNVFTHNPWGEYGNEEHVQLYRALKTLRETVGFRLWYSNYCSNMSMKLMFQRISGFNSSYVMLPTDEHLTLSLKDLYIRHGCWTWYDDWEGFHQECFMEDADVEERREGHIFPVNMLKFHVKPRYERRSKRLSRLVRELGGVLRGTPTPSRGGCV